MKENSYPIIEDYAENELMEDWHVGPYSIEEAKERINAALAEPEGDAVSHSLFMQQLSQDYPWLKLNGNR